MTNPATVMTMRTTTASRAAVSAELDAEEGAMDCSDMLQLSSQ
jgi:hypothetical protein